MYVVGLLCLQWAWLSVVEIGGLGAVQQNRLYLSPRRYHSYLITGREGPTSKWQESSEPVRKSIKAPRAEGKWLGRGTRKASL